MKQKLLGVLITCFLAVMAINHTSAQCSYTILSIDGSSSQNGRAPNLRFKSVNGHYLLTPAECAAAGIVAGQTISSITWSNATAPGVSNNIALDIYMENTTDVANNKSATWATAISTMTLVHSNASESYPNSTTFSIPVLGGTGTSAFVYNGGGLYIAYSQNNNCSGTPVLSTLQVISCNTTSTAGTLLKSSQNASSCTINTLTASAFRPATTLTASFNNNISVAKIYTYAALAAGITQNHEIQAVIFNNGTTTLTNVPITLTISGANTFTATTTIASIQPCIFKTCAFSGFTPVNTGTNTVSVQIGLTDDNTSDNTLTIAQPATSLKSSYKKSGVNTYTNLGLNGSDGNFVAKFNAGTSKLLDSFIVNFIAAGNSYRVSIWDANGNDGAPGNILWTSPNYTTSIGTIAIPITYSTPLSGDFYVGVSQLGTTNVGIASLYEFPMRSGIFYYNNQLNSTTWSDIRTSGFYYYPQYSVMFKNSSPYFSGGNNSLTVCQTATATSINNLLQITDTDAGQTASFSIIDAPRHGSITTGSTVTSGTDVSPTGWSYTPTSSYSGLDTFTVQVNDGNGGISSSTQLVSITAATTWYQDNDGDGYYSSTQSTCASPGIGWSSTPSVNGGNDCDDNDNSKWVNIAAYVDADGDSYTVGGVIMVCSDNLLPSGHSLTSSGTDCDDNDVAINTGTIFYQDADGDTYGNALVTQTGCTAPNGYVSNNTDCDDSNTNIWQTITAYVDADGDGYTVGSLIGVCSGNNLTTGYSANSLGTDCDDNDNTKWQLLYGYIDADNDGAALATGSYMAVCSGASLPLGYTVNGQFDCDDNNASIGVAPVWFRDFDGDGFGGNGIPVPSCTQPVGGYVTNSSDCNDNDNSKWRIIMGYVDADGDGYTVGSLTSICSGAALPTGYSATSLGSDCDDNNSAIATPIVYYQDADNDGFGNAAISQTACIQPTGYVSDNTDCDDNAAAYHAVITYFLDADGDGYGNPLISQTVCVKPTGYVANDLDCSDNSNAIHPYTMYQDFDGDGYGNPSVSISACYLIAGYVWNSDDCDDTNSSLGLTHWWYLDSDGDGHGNNDAFSGVLGCSAPGSNYVLTSDDCDENDNSVWNTSYVTYIDADGDGYTTSYQSQWVCYSNSLSSIYVTSSLGLDCDDANSNIHNAVTYYQDADGDSYGNATSANLSCTTTAPTGYVANNTDCDDNNNSKWRTINAYVDADGDGYTSGSLTVVCYGTIFPSGYTTSFVGNDCNDNNFAIHLGTTWYQDLDGDGYGNAAVSQTACTQPTGYVSDNTDCNDSNIAINPSAIEKCDGLDNNCNGQIDEGLSVTPVAIATASQTNICPGTSITLTVTASNTGLGAISYAWYKNGNFISTAPRTNMYTFQPSSTDVYYCKVGTTYGCATIAKFNSNLIKISVLNTTNGSANNLNTSSIIANATTTTLRDVTLSWQNIGYDTVVFRNILSTTGAWSKSALVTNGSYTIKKLPSGANYQYYVLSKKCGGVTKSEIATFYTGGSTCILSAPVILSKSFNCSNNVTQINYLSAATSFTIGYREIQPSQATKFTLKSISNFSSGTKTNTITGLQPNKQYEIIIVEKCGTSNVSVINKIDTLSTSCITNRLMASTKTTVKDEIINAEFENIEGLNIYPNPSNGPFTIELNCNTCKNLTVEIYTLDQRLIFSNKFDAEQSKIININEELPSGIYFAKVTSTEGYSQIKKLVITTE